MTVVHDSRGTTTFTGLRLHKRCGSWTVFQQRSSLVSTKFAENDRGRNACVFQTAVFLPIAGFITLKMGRKNSV